MQHAIARAAKVGFERRLGLSVRAQRRERRSVHGARRGRRGVTGRGWFRQIDLGRGRGFGGDDVLHVGLERVLVFESVHCVLLSCRERGNAVAMFETLNCGRVREVVAHKRH